MTFHICRGGPEYRISVRGVVIPFEMHVYCGPMPMNKDGSGKNLVPSHPFWHAVSQWVQQGEQFRDAGRFREAIYDSTKPLKDLP